MSGGFFDVDRAAALRVARLAERDGDLVRLADELWDRWVVKAHRLGVCPDCGASTPCTLDLTDRI